jgi:hypothetical protein
VSFVDDLGQLITKLSNVKLVNYGVPQGSVLGPFLFIIYTNFIRTLIKYLGGEAVLYVDDTTVLVSGEIFEEILSKLINILNHLKKTFAELNLDLNWDKTIAMTSNIKDNVDCIKLGDTSIQISNSVKFLGIHMGRDLSWKAQLQATMKKLNRGLFVISQLRLVLEKEQLLKTYYAFIHSHLSFGTLLWGHETNQKTSLRKLFIKQKKAVRLILGLPPRESCRPYFKSQKIMTLTSIYIYQLAKYAFLNTNHCKNAHVHSCNTRIKNKIHRG